MVFVFLFFDFKTENQMALKGTRICPCLFRSFDIWFCFRLENKNFLFVKVFFVLLLRSKNKKQIIAILGHLNFVSVSSRKQILSLVFCFLLSETKSKNKIQAGCSETMDKADLMAVSCCVANYTVLTTTVSRKVGAGRGEKYCHEGNDFQCCSVCRMSAVEFNE